MSRNKTKKFEQNKLRLNIIEPGKPLFERIKGRWREDFFKNANEITLELGCGKGEYTIGLGEKFPNRNYIGIDLKGDRLWVGSGRAIEKDLSNVAFLRTQMQAIETFFEIGEVDEIWLTFPDPRPKDRDEKRRLTHPRYMALYQSIMKPDGWFRFKTDNTIIFDYTMELIENRVLKVKNLEYTRDLYQSPLLNEHHGIVTKYEKLWTEQGEKIKFLKFQFSSKLTEID